MGLIVDIRGDNAKKESPDFRFPEVGISAVYLRVNLKKKAFTP